MPTDSSPIEDPHGLTGEDVFDQEEIKVGTVARVYESDGEPMWVELEGSFGMADKRPVLVPVARLKQEGNKLRVPYSKDHLSNAPEIDGQGGVSEEEDATLRDHYGIDRADQEVRTDTDSYAAQVPSERGTAAEPSD